MNLIDALAWFEYLAAEPQADRFAAVIEKVDELLVQLDVAHKLRLADSIIYATAKRLQQNDEVKDD